MNNRVAFLFCFLPISRSEHTALYQMSLGKSNTRTAFPFLGRCSAGAFSFVSQRAESSYRMLMRPAP